MVAGALFNEALAGFYRSTAAVAARRADAHPVAGRITPPAGSWTSSRDGVEVSAEPDTGWLEDAAR